MPLPSTMVAMKLELRHLRILCAIAEAGSLGNAALALGFSQPALSTQLSRLERLLGGTLFTRTNTGVELTALGQEVVSAAHDILARVDALVQRPSSPSNVDGLTLRLGGTITPVLPGLVTQIKKGHPEVSVVVKSEYAIATLLEMLEADVIDAALVLDFPGRELRDSDAVVSRAFATEPAFVALPSNHPLAQRVEVPLAELSDEAWFITPDDGAGWPDIFFDACTRAGFSPKRTHVLLDEKNLMNFIASGVGISVCQPTMRPVYGVTVKPIQGSPIRLRQLLAWRRDGPAAPLAPLLHRYAADTYRQLIMQTPHYHAWSQRHPRA